MGRAGERKATALHSSGQLRMGTIRTRHHHRQVRHLQQGQIIGGVPEGQHLHLRFTQTLLQSRQGVPFADPPAEQVTHAVAPHNGQPLGRRQGIEAWLNRQRGRHKGHAATPPLRLLQQRASESKQAFPLLSLIHI